MILFLLFVLGIHVGSFLNVCIWRLPRGESVVQPPSHCPNCDTRLRPVDLIPLVSQLTLRGRCRYCGARFSWRYFNIELLTGILFILVGMQPGYIDGGWLSGVWVGDAVRLVRDLIFMATLVVIFWVDYDTQYIQVESVLLLGFIGVALDAWQCWHNPNNLTAATLWEGLSLLPAGVPQSLLAMTLTATVLWLLREFFSWLYNREAMGFGDVMLVGAIAANLGWNMTIITFFFIAVIFGALVGVGLQIPRSIRAFRWATRRRAKNPATSALPWPLVRHSLRKTRMPFGPMLAVGAIIALLYGSSVNQAYVDWINASQENNGVMPNNPSALRERPARGWDG